MESYVTEVVCSAEAHLSTVGVIASAGAGWYSLLMIISQVLQVLELMDIGQVVFWLLLSTQKLQIGEQKQWQAEGGTKQPVMALTTIQERR